MARQSKLTQRLRRALDSEHLSKQLDDNVIEFFVGMLEGDEGQSEDDLVDDWLFFLSGYGGDGGSAVSRDTCKAVLRRMNSRGSLSSDNASPGLSRESSAVTSPPPLGRAASAQAAAAEECPKLEVRGLGEWLAKLSLSHYAAQAQNWCIEQGAPDVEDVIENWKQFSEDLNLKHFENKRVRRRCAPDLLCRSTSAVHNNCDSVQQTLETLRAPTVGPAAAPDEFPVAPEAEGDVGSNEFEGETFGPQENPFTIVAELGVGVTAKVYKCVRGEESFAVKVIGLSRYKMQRDFHCILERLRRETAILFSLRHSNIVSLYEVFETSSRLYLVMELVEGSDLCNEILNRKAAGFQGLQEYEARYVFLQIALGLRFIHSKGVAHRDLKPENVLINRKDSPAGLPEVKISDFGHSKLVNDGYTVGLTRVGTPQYWAPEIADSRTCALGYDVRVDLWSLGVVLYVMLEGRYPSDGNLSRADSRLSDGARSLVRALMQQRPQDRLSLDECLRHEWVMRTNGPLSRVVESCEELERRARAESERRILLPSDPEDVRQLRRDLHMLTTRLGKPVTLCRRGEVAVDWSNPLSDDAWDELMCTLEKHYPDGSFLRPDVHSLECVAISTHLNPISEVPASGDASTCDPSSIAAASTPGRASPSHASDEELAAAAAQLLARQDEELIEAMAAFPMLVEANHGECAPVPRRADLRLKNGRTTLELTVHMPVGYPGYSPLQLESVSLRRARAWETRGRATDAQPSKSTTAAEEQLSSRISTQLQTLASSTEGGRSLLNLVKWLREKVVPDLSSIIAMHAPSVPPQDEPGAPKLVQPRGPGPPATTTGGADVTGSSVAAIDSSSSSAAPVISKEMLAEGSAEVYHKRVCLLVHHHDEKIDHAGASKFAKPGHSFFAYLKRTAGICKVSGLLSFGKPAALIAEGPEDEVDGILSDVEKFPWWHRRERRWAERSKTALTGTAADEWRSFEGFNKVETKEKLKEVLSNKGRLDLYEALMPSSPEKSRKRLPKANGFH